MEDEVPLSGGRVTQGVVRVGDTVRRPAGPASPFVAGLLAHLTARGFTTTSSYVTEPQEPSASTPSPLGADLPGRPPAV